jgi:hypothetical protein
MILYKAESKTQLHFGEMGTNFQAVPPFETSQHSNRYGRRAFRGDTAINYGWHYALSIALARIAPN